MLCAAAEAGDLESLKRVLDSRADANTATDDWAALLHAARNDHADAADALMTYGAHPNATDSNGTTALMLAARYNHCRVACTLLSYGACPNITDASGSTALAFAASSFFYNRCDDTMTLLLLHHRADPNLTAADGRGYGCSLDVNFKRVTPLMHAARFCRYDVVRALLLHGADPNRRASCGSTALTLVTSAEVADARAALALLPSDASEASSIARLLLRHGANADATNSMGQTALSLAVGRGDGLMVHELLRHGASARALQLHDAPREGHFPQLEETDVAAQLRRHLRHHVASCAATFCCRWLATAPSRCLTALQLQQLRPSLHACAGAVFRLAHRLLLLCRGAVLKRLVVLLCYHGSSRNAVIAMQKLQRMVVARSCSMRNVRKQLAIFYDFD
jgi:ankyrin repeat protein